MKKNKVIIILQARCGSSRFPNKVIYPIKKLQLAIYCAKRLNPYNKYKLILATSKNKTDDYLVTLAKNFNIEIFRGQESNVLKRFNDIAKKLSPEDVIVRATADNPLPDRYFLEECLKIFKKNGLQYFMPDQKFYGLPKGLNLEILTVKTLRKQKYTKHNKEHVTYSLRENYNTRKLNANFIENDFSKLNFSIDYTSDYLFVKRKMEKFEFNENWKKIINNENK